METMTNDGKLIFIADDSKINVTLIRNALEKDGYRVEAAYDGESALEKLAAISPDLIFLDVLMPGVNGYELCKRIKTDERLKNVPVIMITSMSDETDREWGLEMGADEYLTKPFEYETIYKLVLRFLHNSPAKENRS